MCSVQLETVEAGVLRVECGVDPRLLQVVEVRGGEFSSQAGAVQCQAGGADGFDLGVQARVLAAFDSEVPQLRNDRSAFGVDGVDNRLPATQVESP